MSYETRAQQDAYASLRHSPPLKAAQPLEAALPRKRISAIIPFRDKWDLTAACVQSLLNQDLTNTQLLIVLVDNNSSEPTTKAGINSLLASALPPHIEIRRLELRIPFNYSALNNIAAAKTVDFSPEALVFINNDIKLTDTSTIAKMTDFLITTPGCGSVGCTLLFPTRRIQHLFIFVGCKIVGAHPFKGVSFDATDPWYQAPRPVPAATAALLMIKAADFDAVHGFEEQLPSCYQDVDLALKLQGLGLTNWVLPYLTAVHYETQTRSPVHSWDEVRFMYAKWGNELTNNRFSPPEFSRWSEAVALSCGEGSYPWTWLIPSKLN